MAPSSSASSSSLNYDAAVHGVLHDEAGEVYTLHDESCRSFEWLTSPASLKPILKQYLPPLVNDTNNHNNNNDDEWKKDVNVGTQQTPFHRHRRRRQALHVGCGTSLLGEWLADEFAFDWVANMDINPSALRWLETHWQQRQQEDQEKEQEQQEQEQEQHHHHQNQQQQQQTFHCVDIAKNTLSDKIASGSMDLVMDKSTLDCGLCTGDMTIGLLREVYRCLRPDGGIYVVISFHHVDFILPLLRDCPGAQWNVTTITTIRRQVEDLVSKTATTTTTTNHVDDDNGNETSTPPPSITMDSIKNRTTWSSSGSFQPDDHYHDTVNVFVCQRYSNNNNNNDKTNQHHDDDAHTITTTPTATTTIVPLDQDAVSRHVQTVCNDWFQTHNPMVTPQRVAELQQRFQEQQQQEQSTITKSLEQCYDILFNDEEKEHLSYLFFLEDWAAFRATRPELPNDCMTWETARDFLQEMQ